MRTIISKVISGGQTGADKGGLIAARNHKIPTGGTAPYGYNTEAGPDESLKSYGLRQWATNDYRVRTRLNIQDSDITVVLSSNPDSPGSRLTLETCKSMGKDVVLVSPDDELAVEKIAWAILNSALKKKSAVCVNVAGNRESKSRGIEARTTQIMGEVFEIDLKAWLDSAETQL